jgi:hypothetical protein
MENKTENETNIKEEHARFVIGALDITMQAVRGIPAHA